MTTDRLIVTKELKFNLNALDNALARGVTTIIWIMAAGQGERAFFVVNLRDRLGFCGVVSTQECQGVFGHSEPGIYEGVVTQVHRGEQMPSKSDLH